MKIWLRLAGSAVAVVACSGAAAAPYTVTPISVPGSYFDYAVAVTESGVVLGVYYDESNQPHGYLYQSGSVTPFDVPGAAATRPVSINASGDIVGSYTDQNDETYGFVYRNRKYFTVGYQGYTSTELTGINDKRITCGDSYNGFSSAFTYKAGRFREIDKEANSYATAINNNGVVLASVNGEPAIYEDKAVTDIPVDGGTATGINDKNTVVGYLSNSTQGNVAFAFATGIVTTFAAPGATQTFFNAINIDGVIAGGYVDANFNQYAFIKKNNRFTQLPTIGASYMTPSAINSQDVVAGSYLDDNDVTRSFVATQRQSSEAAGSPQKHQPSNQ